MILKLMLQNKYLGRLQTCENTCTEVSKKKEQDKRFKDYLRGSKGLFIIRSREQSKLKSRDSGVFCSYE